MWGDVGRCGEIWISPRISPYLPVSPRISPHRPISRAPLELREAEQQPQRRDAQLLSKLGGEMWGDLGRGALVRDAGGSSAGSATSAARASPGAVPAEGETAAMSARRAGCTLATSPSAANRAHELQSCAAAAKAPTFARA